jgi:hypothetical protein
LPEEKRKIIFWLIVVIVGIFLLIWWVKNLQTHLKGFEPEKIKEELQLPKLEEELKNLPKFEAPEISEEELKKLEEILKEQ